MKRALVVCTGWLAVGFMLVTSASAQVPTTVGFQGRLTNAGTPVPDGPYTVSFSLWSQLIGGSQLSEESQVVTTTGGLFSTELGHTPGFFNVCPPCDVWLQIAITAGGPPQVLSPRTHMASSMSALVAGEVHGESSSGSLKARGTVRVITAGGLALGYTLGLESDADGDGKPEYAVKDSASSSGVHRMAMADVDDDGMPDHVVETQVGDAHATIRAATHTPNQPAYSEATLNVSDDRALLGLKEYDPLKAYTAGDMSLVADSTGSSAELRSHGTSEAVIAVRGESSSMHYKTYQPGQPVYGNFLAATSDSGAVLDLTHVGPTGESGMRAKNIRKNITVTLFKSDKSQGAHLSVDSGLSELVLEADTDGDGFSEGSNDLKASPTGIRHSISWNSQPDLGSNANQKWNINLNPTGQDVTGSSDADGDGVAEHSGWQKVDNSQASMAVETDADEDGDPETGVSSSSIETRSTLKTYFENGDIPDANRVRDSVDGDGAHLDVQALSTGGGCTLQCDAGYTRGAMRVSRSEPDPLGVLQVTEEVVLEARDDTASLSISGGPIDGGNHADGWNVYSIQGKNAMQGNTGQFVAPGEPVIGTMELSTTSTSSAMVLGDLAGDGRMDLVCSRDALAHQSDAVMTVQAGGRRVAMSSSHTSCGLVMVDATGGTDDTAIVIDAVTKRFGIGVTEPSYAIEHSSGAHLTEGGVWTNASDAALKENFQAVDGDDLLARIDRLPITRWNYRAESDDVTHIGPTAQDFKRLFGVGDNDRSISTVDPSGIALAAIKVLHKENDELREQNLQLKNQLDLLNRKLDLVLARQ